MGKSVGVGVALGDGDGLADALMVGDGLGDESELGPAGEAPGPTRPGVGVQPASSSATARATAPDARPTPRRSDRT
ncbi:hypothetical protein [Pengzhenrongella phosphoraccumulans]|uniref:hypothetical protein n=1 Tax=Pengzhenrongella phosphoraccumulans TaxID=3114394 RepID=UPI003890EE49